MADAEREIKELMRKAQESLEAAKLLLQRGYYDFAASRGYYAMFYAAEAALLSKGLSFSKHSAVVAAFGQHLAAPGELPTHLHRYLLDAFDLRMVGDYDAPGAVGESRASQVLGWAEEFLQEIERFLAASGYRFSSEEAKRE
ncbi:MAG: HEPN domain-containing protein [Acetothermia bacterium 64_32]|nr:MAG: HEPN domain-containing protein [Acetothermia bacterium 64_32]HAF71481.1 DNA-binding protein [Candidatus Acetothermia bacterium]